MALLRLVLAFDLFLAGTPIFCTPFIATALLDIAIKN
jgi:hypothetical protein